MNREHFVPKTAARKHYDPSIAPALTVDPGDIVAFETDDSGYERLVDMEPEPMGEDRIFNLVTGPVFVRGAKPGDALEVLILDVGISRCFAAWMPEYGAFKTDVLRVRMLQIEGDRVRITKSLTVPMQPMIGCIGVAPASGPASTVSPACEWGGNMDLTEVRPGATVLLPVQVEGALLSIGDLHAAMGDAEPTYLGLEAGGTARVRVGLRKGAKLPFPRILLPGLTVCIGMAEKEETAGQLAMDQVFEILTKERGLSPFDAFAFASARVSLKLGGPASPIMLALLPDFS